MKYNNYYVDNREFDLKHKEIQKIDNEIEQKEKELLEATTIKKKTNISKYLYKLKVRKVECQYLLDKKELDINIKNNMYDDANEVEALSCGVENKKQKALLEISNELLEKLRRYERILRVVKKKESRANKLSEDIWQIEDQIKPIEEKIEDLRQKALFSISEYQRKMGKQQEVEQQNVPNYQVNGRDINNGQAMLTSNKMLTNKDINL